MSDLVAVSIICNTYNHEAFIHSALEGFVKQKCNFNFEVLVHDDASTDNTAAVIREYEKKYPHLIKAIYETENQWSKHDGSLGRIQRERARGKYIAFCEGDDYWIDDRKLQKQYDALEMHSELDICTHAQITVNAQTGQTIGETTCGRKDRVISVEEVILGEGGFVGTNTIMCRRDAYVRYSEYPFAKIMSYDYTLQIGLSLRGGMLYLCDYMSVYRYAVPGSWCTRLKAKSDVYQINFLNQRYTMLNQFDYDTNGKYHNAVLGRYMLYEILTENSSFNNIKILKKYRAGFRALTSEQKVNIIIKCACPWLIRLKHKVCLNGK